MVYAGLDLSINSTGVCFYNSDDLSATYYIVGSKFTKKALQCDQHIVTLEEYYKDTIPKDCEYYDREGIKTQNIYNIVNSIDLIIDMHCPGVVTIEGVSFQSNGSVIDLAGLNYIVRKTLLDKGVTIYIVSPTQNKKFATGNGQAEKDVMISAWKKADPRVVNIPPCIKTDDLADAYFLARYGEYIHNK